MGCSTTPSAKEVAWSSLDSAEQSRAIDQIAERCQLPRDFFELHGDQLTIHPKATEKYQRVDCALEELRKLRGGPQLGFIGNEAPAEDPK